MAKKFTTYVNVFKDDTNAEYQTFAPGDNVPDWALDRVGDHTYTEDDTLDIRLGDPHYRQDDPEVQFSTPTTLPPVTGGVSANEAEADEDADGGYAELTKDELKDLCEERGLPVSGNKAELVARLEEDDEE